MLERTRQPSSNGTTGSQMSMARVGLALCLALLVLRLFALMTSPLELGPDEAQYWGWSRNLDWGYFSKPPLIAWAIAATTSLFGDSEWAIRLGAPLAHVLCALTIAYTARLIAGSSASIPAALLYLSAPGVAISSFIVSTDAFLLTASALTLATCLSMRRSTGRLKGAALGACLGIGLLAKYAMVYAIFAIIIAALFDQKFRKSLFGWPLLSAIIVLSIVILPNIYWNSTHDFSTLNHTAANANFEGRQYNVAKAGDFFLGQFGVFGPLAFPLLLWALASRIPIKSDPSSSDSSNDTLQWFRQTKPLFAAMILLPIIVVTIGAFISRANANWAAIAYPAAAIFVAAWAVIANRTKWLYAAIALNLVFSIAIIAITTAPRLADQAGMSNSIKRTRGWSDITQSIASTAFDERDKMATPFAAIVFDNRLVFHEVDYYGRKTPLPPIKMWRKTASPLNHAQASAPLNAGEGPFMVVLSSPDNKAMVSSDFKTFEPIGSTTVFLGGGKKRHLDFFRATHFSPAPRDAAYQKRWSADEKATADEDTR